jgi:broad specificity phosphatase PhoE
MTEQLVRTDLSFHAPPAPGSCALYLVRHGTTTLNVQNRYRGRRDVPLDAQGYQDAVDAARALSGVGLAAVYSGPLRRTLATAQIVADEARVPDIRVLHGLNNVDYGVWEGMTAEEAAMYDPVQFDAYKRSPDIAMCPSGERLRDAQARIMEAVALIGRRHPDEAVAAVTHAVMIRLVCAALRPSDGESWRIPVGRGSAARFDIVDGVVRLTRLPDGSDID